MLGERFPKRLPTIIEIALPDAHATYSPSGLH
jgi:hypothetical protein